MLFGLVIGVGVAVLGGRECPYPGSTGNVAEKTSASKRGSALPSETFRPANRLALQPIPEELTLAPHPPEEFPEAFYTQPESFHPLYNLAMNPEDSENGWEWAWETFLWMSPEQRPAYLDQIASITPAWAWARLDAVLQNAAWGPDVLRPLFQRLLDLPPQDQLSRLWRISQNRLHPCWEQANGLLQAYFPDVRPGDYSAYLARIQKP